MQAIIERFTDIPMVGFIHQAGNIWRNIWHNTRALHWVNVHPFTQWRVPASCQSVLFTLLKCFSTVSVNLPLCLLCLPPSTGLLFFCSVEFLQLFQLFHLYPGIAAMENNPSSCFGCTMADFFLSFFAVIQRLFCEKLIQGADRIP